VKLSLLLVCLGVCGMSSAETSPRHLVYLGSGLGSGTHLSAEMDAWDNGDSTQYSVKSSRVLELGYVWRWQDRNLLTVSALDETLTQTEQGLHAWAASPKVEYREKIRAFQLGIRHLYGQAGSGPRLFSGIAVGHVETSGARDGASTRNSLSQLDVLGIHSDERFHWFLAFGLGDSGLVRGGLGVAF
jgi:hypothetical protein